MELPRGHAKWVRQSSAGTALERTPEILIGAHSASSTGDGIVLAGVACAPQRCLAAGYVDGALAMWSASAAADQVHRTVRHRDSQHSPRRLALRHC